MKSVTKTTSTKPCPRDTKNPLKPRIHSLKENINKDGVKIVACHKCGAWFIGRK